jgi:hypothetical protein
MATVVEIIRHARFACEAYSSPGQFITAEAYAIACTEAFDDLCEKLGYPLPRIEGVWDTTIDLTESVNA